MNAYVVVENAGYSDEQQTLDFPSYRLAALFLIEHYEPDELEKLNVQIMKYLPDADGSLTTEF